MSTLHLQALKTGLDAVLALGTPKLSFMATGYTPSSTTHSYYSDISASVASGTTALTLSSVTTTLDVANARVELDSANPVSGAVTATTNKFSLWVDTGVAGTSPVLATIDITEGTITTVAGTITITVNAEGYYSLKAV